jgi:predicted TIM-barrel fold metal-dependent hydrolase
VLARDLDRAEFETACTEADLPAPPGVSYLDGQLGVALRRWCPPALGLAPHADIDAYLHRRAELGWREATRALLAHAGLAELLVDTGLCGDDLLTTDDLGQLAAARVREVVRLERVAEAVAAQGPTAAGFAGEYARALAARVDAGAVGVKSIVAYRWGLAIPPDRPSPVEVARAAGDWLRAGAGRLTDAVLLRHLLWAGVDTGLPVQLHCGFGDRDLGLRDADPALAQPFVAAVAGAGVPLILLHCYPFHRNAGWLAQVYPHVYLDVGLSVGHLGARATSFLAECLELAPFGKVLFSTDAYLLPELYLLGAAQFRHSLGALVDAWVAEGAMAAPDAQRLTAAIGGGNARRVYGRPGVSP